MLFCGYRWAEQRLADKAESSVKEDQQILNLSFIDGLSDVQLEQFARTVHKLIRPLLTINLLLQVIGPTELSNMCNVKSS